MKRPSPSLVISLIALFVALSGSAYAISRVQSEQIGWHAVTKPKIDQNAITGPKIQDGSIGIRKLRHPERLGDSDDSDGPPEGPDEDPDPNGDPDPDPDDDDEPPPDDDDPPDEDEQPEG